MCEPSTWWEDYCRGFGEFWHGFAESVGSRPCSRRYGYDVDRTFGPHLPVYDENLRRELSEGWVRRKGVHPELIYIPKGAPSIYGVTLCGERRLEDGGTFLPGAASVYSHRWAPRELRYQLLCHTYIPSWIVETKCMAVERIGGPPGWVHASWFTQTPHDPMVEAFHESLQRHGEALAAQWALGGPRAAYGLLRALHA